jgi:site-specific DNA-methyltransferase (adenine-specific)
MLGDCLERLREIPDGSVDMVMADLPYGTTACKWDSVIPFNPLWEQYRRVCKKNAAIVLTACQPFTSALVMSNASMFKYELIWEKTKSTGFLDCSYRPMRSHENILVFYNAKPVYNPQKTKGAPWVRGRVKRPKSCWGEQAEHYAKNDTGERHPKSVMLISNPNNGSKHPTQKPVALMEYLIRTYTNKCETVLDNTMGSGTTGVACVTTGRNFIGIERDEGYFEIATSRIAAASPLESLQTA